MILYCNPYLFDLRCLSNFWPDMWKLRSDSRLPKKLCYLLDWKPFKNDEKCFLFHLKSSCSQDIKVFSMTFFSHVGKRAWLEKDKVCFKIHDATTRFYTQLQYTYCPISESKGNKTMKVGQLIEKIMQKMRQGD